MKVALQHPTEGQLKDATGKRMEFNNENDAVRFRPSPEWIPVALFVSEEG